MQTPSRQLSLQNVTHEEKSRTLLTGTLFASSTGVHQELTRSRPSTAIVVAHPDDEIIGAASVLLRRGRDNAIVHVTDGAPRNLRDARAAGFGSRAAYARARRSELSAALSHVGIGPESCHQLWVVDQEAVFELERVTRRLAAFFWHHAPSCVITHPYEGGHPDHDAAALGVHAAARLIDRAGGVAPTIVEMTSYHAGPDGIETGAFLGTDPPATTIALGTHERVVKRAMLDCFATQQQTLMHFGTECELFRTAPRYCFVDASHPGPLFYEQFDWGVDGRTWREHAARVLLSLDLDPRACL